MNMLYNYATQIGSFAACNFLPVATLEEQPRPALTYPSRYITSISLSALRLTGILQTSLDLEQILNLFAAELATGASHDGLTFFSPGHGEYLSIGKRASYSVSYCLNLDDRSLGSIFIYRVRPFSPSEIDFVEDLIQGLLYPLRNALLYQEALAAAFRDSLTGIGNRAALDAALDREVKLAHRDANPLSILVLDIDRFRLVNDTYGHLAGDCVLRTLAHCISSCVRSTDVVTRYGGEELAVLVNNTNITNALSLAERIRVAVEALQIRYENHTIKITVSIGVADLQTEDDRHGLFCRADAALYWAKENGRNRVHCCTLDPNIPANEYLADS